MSTHVRGPYNHWLQNHRRPACLKSIKPSCLHLVTWLSFGADEAKASCLFLSTFAFPRTSELYQIQKSRDKIVSSAESTKDKPGRKFGLDLVTPGQLAIRGPSLKHRFLALTVKVSPTLCLKEWCDSELQETCTGVGVNGTLSSESQSATQTWPITNGILRHSQEKRLKWAMQRQCAGTY